MIAQVPHVPPKRHPHDAPTDRAGSMSEPALFVGAPSEWRYGGMGVALVALSETKRHSRNPHGVRVSGVSGVSGVFL